MNTNNLVSNMLALFACARSGLECRELMQVIINTVTNLEYEDDNFVLAFPAYSNNYRYGERRYYDLMDGNSIVINYPSVYAFSNKCEQQLASEVSVSFELMSEHEVKFEYNNYTSRMRVFIDQHTIIDRNYHIDITKTPFVYIVDRTRQPL